MFKANKVFEGFLIGTLTRTYVATIAARSAPAETIGFKKDDAKARFAQVNSAGETSESSADDDYVCFCRFGEGLESAVCLRRRDIPGINVCFAHCYGH